MWLGLFLVVQWLALCPFTTGSMDCSIPDPAAKIPQIVQHGQKTNKTTTKKKKKTYVMDHNMKIKEDETRDWFPT